MKSDKIIQTLKQGVLKNKKYSLKPIECPIKLNQNESPYDIPGKIKNKIIDKIKNKKWNIYPDFTPEDLYKKAAKYLKVKKENILIGNGSNEMIFTLFAATLETGKKVIIPEPTFTVYKLIASNLNADIKSVRLNSDFSFNINSIMQESCSPGSVTIISSPNSPTGTYVSRDNLKKIIDISGGIVIIDEAYIQFGGESVINLINKYPNLIILRTFSKVFGLAGLRIGIMIGNKNIISELSKVKLPYNLNIFNLTTLDIIFDNINIINNNLKMILDNKKYLKENLSIFKELSIIPSAANFFLVKVKNSKWLFEKLLKFGILVRDVAYYPMLDNCLRISVGDKSENLALINALKKIYKY
jgi:histidinol-phosphate aminotransferase